MKTVLITGAGSGIGLATALAFLRAGWSVAGIGRDPAKLDNLRAKAGDAADRVATLSVDATTDEAPARSVALATETFGRLDCLVNNAGVGSPKPVHDTDDAELDHFLGLMLRAPFRFIRESLPSLEAGGAIVNVSSTYGLVGGLRGGAYSSAKSGLIGLTTHVACQYGSAGIRCNAVAPGFIPTEMTSNRLSSESYRRLNTDMTPSYREGLPEDVAQAIVFLAGDLSGWINGQVLAVDGGWSSTKYLSEEALSANRTIVTPKFAHSGRQLKA